MKDTTASVEQRVKESMMRLSGEERLKMGASMFDSAKELVIASLPPGTSSEVRKAIFMRFYGKDFDEVERERILEYLASNTGDDVNPRRRDNGTT